MTQVRMPFVQTRRDSWTEINLSAIEHNVKLIKGYLSEKTKFLAVIKADAYGHGSTMIAPTLLASGVDMLGVASVDEGLQLREAGVEAPILVLGSVPTWAVLSAVENDIMLSIFTHDHINACIDAFRKSGKKAKVHIKIDTGMHRIGIFWDKAVQFIREVANVPEIELIGAFTHMACAENQKVTLKQKTWWENVINEVSDLNLMLHAANTACTIAYKDMHYDMVRAGIGIYGLNPDYPAGTNTPDFKQAMSLRGRVAYVEDIPANSGISYGYTYITSYDDTRVATIPIGYADGVSRELSNKIYGLINGKRVRQIGNITMDQMMFDVTDAGDVRIGDVITLLGKDGDEFIPIDYWANKLNTISYEITCRLKIRLPRVYTRDGF